MSDNRESVRRLILAVNQIDGTYYRIARRLHAKENTLSLLYALGDGKAHSQKQICEEWQIPKTTINTVVKECVDAGYLELLSDAGGRQKRIRLTESGMVYSAHVLDPLIRAEDEAMAQALQAFPREFIDGVARFATLFTNECQKQILNKPMEE